MEYAETIRKYRKQAGFTQEELAKKMGMSATLITMWETSKRIPSIPSLDLFCKAVGITRSDFFNDGKVEELNKCINYKGLCDALTNFTVAEDELQMELKLAKDIVENLNVEPLGEKEKWKCICAIEELEDVLNLLRGKKLKAKYLISKFESFER